MEGHNRASHQLTYVGNKAKVARKRHKCDNLYSAFADGMVARFILSEKEKKYAVILFMYAIDKPGQSRIGQQTLLRPIVFVKFSRCTCVRGRNNIIF